jgi:hypothetical protein
MQFDTKGRLWAAWADLSEMGTAQADERRLIILHDDNNDGARSRDGVRQGAESARLRVLERRRDRHLQPEILFLKDTDGDDVADVRTSCCRASIRPTRITARTI